MLKRTRYTSQNPLYQSAEGLHRCLRFSRSIYGARQRIRQANLQLVRNNLWCMRSRMREISGHSL